MIYLFWWSPRTGNSGVTRSDEHSTSAYYADVDTRREYVVLPSVPGGSTPTSFHEALIQFFFRVQYSKT